MHIRYVSCVLPRFVFILWSAPLLWIMHAYIHVYQGAQTIPGNEPRLTMMGPPTSRSGHAAAQAVSISDAREG